VGSGVFSTKSKNANTPPEWAGTLLRAFFAVRKQSPPQVSPVEEAIPCKYGEGDWQIQAADMCLRLWHNPVSSCLVFFE
jgi:hypothetical protein